MVEALVELAVEAPRVRQLRRVAARLDTRRTSARRLSTAGDLPLVDDPRVRFFPGWVEDTLPLYEWPEHEVLFALFDADLYSSTAVALATVRPHLRPGSFVYFDDFHHRCDELRAFAALIDEHDVRFELVGALRELSKVLFRVV